MAGPGTDPAAVACHIEVQAAGSLYAADPNSAALAISGAVGAGSSFNGLATKFYETVQYGISQGDSWELSSLAATLGVCQLTNNPDLTQDQVTALAAIVSPSWAADLQGVTYFG